MTTNSTPAQRCAHPGCGRTLGQHQFFGDHAFVPPVAQRCARCGHSKNTHLCSEPMCTRFEEHLGECDVVGGCRCKEYVPPESKKRCIYPKCGYEEKAHGEFPPHGGCASDIHEWMIHSSKPDGFCHTLDCHPFVPPESEAATTECTSGAGCSAGVAYHEGPCAVVEPDPVIADFDRGLIALAKANAEELCQPYARCGRCEDCRKQTFLRPATTELGPHDYTHPAEYCDEPGCDHITRRTCEQAEKAYAFMRKTLNRRTELLCKADPAWAELAMQNVLKAVFAKEDERE